MWFKKIFYRMYQFVFNFAALFLDFSEPVLYKGEGTIKEVIQILKKRKIQTVFIITDKHIEDLGVIKPLEAALKTNHLKYSIYNETTPNPSITLVLDATKHYHKIDAEAIISIGGGSVIDLAKMVQIKSKYKNRKIESFKGVLKVHRRLVHHIAIPTTVGTGSEATLAAVVSNEETHEKFAIMDPQIIPSYAILDHNLVKNLPKDILAQTAMDALTHAIEAYIGRATTSKTREYSLKAIDLILKNINKAYNGDFKSISNLHYASYLAGVAFTRSYVGNVHAIAHTMSGFYNLGHGLSNAVILPFVLEYYGNKIDKKVKRIESYAKIDSLIDQIKKLKEELNIPKTFNGLIKDEDLDSMINNAYKEANPLYPVPVIFSKNDFLNLYKKINEVIE